MSKSLGNFFTIREVLSRYDPEVVRFFILRAHYRSPLNYSDKHLDEARSALARLYTALKGVSAAPAGAIDWAERARRALSRGDGRRLQYSRGDRRAVRARNEVNRSARLPRRGLLKAARRRARAPRPPGRSFLQGGPGGRVDGRSDRGGDRGAECGPEGAGLRRGRPDTARNCWTPASSSRIPRRVRPGGKAEACSGRQPAAARCGYSRKARSRPRIVRLTKFEPL